MGIEKLFKHTSYYKTDTRFRFSSVQRFQQAKFCRDRVSQSGIIAQEKLANYYIKNSWTPFYIIICRSLLRDNSWSAGPISTKFGLLESPHRGESESSIRFVVASVLKKFFYAQTLLCKKFWCRSSIYTKLVLLTWY